MRSSGAAWAVVMAVEGSIGCGSDHSLLRGALARASRVVPEDRVVVVVPQGHWRHPGSTLAAYPPENIVTQPDDHGTATGVLLSLLAISRRDPGADILFVPSCLVDVEESAVEAAMHRALATLQTNPRRLVVFGVAPGAPDPNRGWVLPLLAHRGSVRPVAAFVERPDPMLAGLLLKQGALWSSSLFAVRTRALHELYRRTLPGLLDALWDAAAIDPRDPATAASPCARIPSHDFAGDVLQRVAGRLLVLTMPPAERIGLGVPPGRAHRAAPATNGIAASSVQRAT